MARRLAADGFRVVVNYAPNASEAVASAIEAAGGHAGQELGPRGITVNVVAPGPTATEIFLTGRPTEVVRRMTEEIPLGRLGEPDDVARKLLTILNAILRDGKPWKKEQAHAKASI